MWCHFSLSLGEDKSVSDNPKKDRWCACIHSSEIQGLYLMKLYSEMHQFDINGRPEHLLEGKGSMKWKMEKKNCLGFCISQIWQISDVFR